MVGTRKASRKDFPRRVFFGGERLFLDADQKRERWTQRTMTAESTLGGSLERADLLRCEWVVVAGRSRRASQASFLSLPKPTIPGARVSQAGGHEMFAMARSSREEPFSISFKMFPGHRGPCDPRIMTVCKALSCIHLRQAGSGFGGRP